MAGLSSNQAELLLNAADNVLRLWKMGEIINSGGSIVKPDPGGQALLTLEAIVREIEYQRR
jgi:hypothetical protein